MIAAKGVTMAALAANLSNRVGRVVVDRTGLSEEFDLQVEFSPESLTAPPPDDPARIDRPLDAGPSLFTAVREQLGLELESTRGPVMVLVIDSVTQPTLD